MKQQQPLLLFVVFELFTINVVRISDLIFPNLVVSIRLQQQQQQLLNLLTEVIIFYFLFYVFLLEILILIIIVKIVIIKL